MKPLLLLTVITYAVTALWSKDGWYIGLWWFPIGAWIEHIVTTIRSDRLWLLLIGALVFPIGIINGLMVWADSLVSSKGFRPLAILNKLQTDHLHSIGAKLVSFACAFIVFASLGQLLGLLGTVLAQLLIEANFVTIETREFETLEASGNIVRFFLSLSLSVVTYKQMFRKMT
jgi:uncharacterized protein YacL